MLNTFHKILKLNGTLVIDSNLIKNNYKAINSNKNKVLTSYGENKFNMFLF